MATSSITAVQELATIFTFDAKTGDITVAQREVSRLRQTISGLSSTTDRAERSMAGMGRRLVAVLGGAMLARRFFESNRELERLDVTMRSVSGSAAEANNNFNFILDWAARTPFDIRQVTRSFVALRAQGIQPTLEMFNGIGNLSSALGSDFANLILAAQRAAQGRTQRLQQAILAPVSLSNSGDTLTIRFRGEPIEIDVSGDDGTVRVLEALAQIGNENFGGQMTELINRLDGAMSNFGDILDITFKEIGTKSGMNAAIVDLLQNLTTMLQKGNTGLAIVRALTVPIRMLNWLLNKLNENSIQFNRWLTLIALVLGTLTASTAVYWFGRLGAAIFSAARAASFLHLAFMPLAAAFIVLEDIFTFFSGGNSVFGRWTKDIGPLGRAARSLADILRPLFEGEEMDLSSIVETIVRAADTVFSEIIPAFWQAMYDYMPSWARNLLDLLGITGNEGSMPTNIGGGGADIGEEGDRGSIDEMLDAAHARLRAAYRRQQDTHPLLRGISGADYDVMMAQYEVSRLGAQRDRRRGEAIRAERQTRRQEMVPQVQRGLRSIIGRVTSIGDLFGGTGSTTSSLAMSAVADALNRARNVTMTVGAVNVDISSDKVLQGVGSTYGASDAIANAVRLGVTQALNEVAEDMENSAGESKGVLQ